MYRYIIFFIVCITLISSQAVAKSKAEMDLDKALLTYKKFVHSNAAKLTSTRYDVKKGVFKEYKLPKLEIGFEAPNGVMRSMTIGLSELQSVGKILTALSKGEVVPAAKEGAGVFIGKAMPVVGQYLVVQDTVKMAIESGIANWTEDLYHTKSYTTLLDIVNDTFLDQIKRGTPYLPSIWITDSALRERMRQVEGTMFNRWFENNDVFLEQKNTKFIARVNYVMKKLPKDREVFNLFLKQIAGQQKGYFTTNFKRAMAREAEKARRALEKKSQQAIQRYFTKNSLPSKLDLQAAPCAGGTGLCVEYGANLTPTIQYSFNFYLEKNEKQFSQMNVKEIKTDKLSYRGRAVMSSPTDLNGYQLVMIVENQFGRSESKTIDLKTGQIQGFSITGTLGTYDGKPIKTTVQNGQTLAFQTRINYPKSPEPVASTLHWQLEDKQGKVVGGIEKTEQVYESGGAKTHGFRFIPDEVKNGDYRVRLTHFKTSEPTIKKTAVFPIRIQQSMRITKLVATPDKAKQTHHNVLHPDQSALLYVHYALSPDTKKVTAHLSAISQNTGKKLDSVEVERPLKGDPEKQRVGLLLDQSLLNIDDTIVFKAELSTSDGKTYSDQTMFKVKSYALKVKSQVLNSGTPKYITLQAPGKFQPPYKVKFHSGNKHLRVYSQGGLKLKLVGDTEGDTINTTLNISVTDAKNRTANGSSRISILPLRKKKIVRNPKQSRSSMPYVKTAKPYSGKTAKVSGKTASTGNKQLGKQRYQSMVEKAMQVYPPCYPSKIKQTVRRQMEAKGKQFYTTLGAMSQRRWNQKMERDLKSTCESLANQLLKMKHDACLEQFATNMYRKGWINLSKKNQAIASMKQNKRKIHASSSPRYGQTKTVVCFKHCKCIQKYNGKKWMTIVRICYNASGYLSHREEWDMSGKKTRSVAYTGFSDNRIERDCGYAGSQWKCNYR